MKQYLSVLGRQPEISLAELSALFQNVQQITAELATFQSASAPDINRLGGSLKLAQKLDSSLIDYLANLPDGKITIGISDYSPRATAKSVSGEAMKIKKILTKKGRSVRIVQNKSAVLSTATAHHNKLGKKPQAVEIILVNGKTYLGLGVQDITAYARRDQARPARDAKVGMLPPKLAQILINLCGPLPTGARVLDPFCGTGVLLQEAALMGYTPYGTDADPRMVEYSKKNLAWLLKTKDLGLAASQSEAGVLPISGSSRQRERTRGLAPVTTGGQPGARDGKPQSRFDVRSHSLEAQVTQGDATTFQWNQPINAVACETYLGQPMSTPPAEIKLKQEKQKCQAIIVGFLKNLAPQITKGTPVTLAIPAWLRPDGTYSRLKLLDDFINLEYNRAKELGFDDLLYYRDGQIVARQIITLRKK